MSTDLNFSDVEIREALTRLKAGRLDYFDREIGRPFTALMEDWLKLRGQSAVMHEGCNYLSLPDSICDKCGKPTPSVFAAQQRLKDATLLTHRQRAAVGYAIKLTEAQALAKRKLGQQSVNEYFEEQLADLRSIIEPLGAKT